MVPGTSTSNPLAGDRHYDGLHASDGTPIDTRTKHRQYMKEKGLTINTDFTETWKAAAVEREKISSGVSLADRRRDVQEAFSRATQN